MKKRNWFKVAVFAVVFSAMPLTALAFQDLPPDFPGNVDDQVPSAPISGLVALGLVVGAGYGVKKVRDNK
jgi:hypothetical protein